MPNYPQNKRFPERSQAFPKVQSFLNIVRGIRGLQDAREAMGLSLRECGELIAEYEKRRKRYAKPTISNWCCSRRARRFKAMSTDQLNATALMLDDWLREKTGRNDIRFQMKVNSPWHCWIEFQCNVCGKWERGDLRIHNWTRCKKHRGI
jgi:hypothetical protein